VRQAFATLLEELARRAPSQPGPNGPDGLQEAMSEAAGLLRLQRDSALIEAVESIGKAKVTLNRWPSQSVGREARDLRDAFWSSRGDEAVRAFREYRHFMILEFVRPAGLAAEQDRLRAATLNYEDLLSLTARLLRERPPVREAFARKYRHLLVDEFQDTDPLQVEIMFLLTGQEPGETDWRRLTPRPGSLFVVGDPKQSIYRFRRADIAIYQEVGRRIQATGGAIVPLTTSFRSLPEVADTITSAFRILLPEQGTPQQAAFAPLNPVRDARDDEGTGVRVIDLDAKLADEIAADDADRIAAYIAWALTGHLTIHDRTLDRPARPDDFLILLPTRNRIEVYEAALQAAGLPVQTARARQFGGSSFVPPLLVLLDAVADPENPVPLLGALRGPLLALSDQDLYDWRRSGGRIALYGAPGEGPVGQALERLRLYRRWTLEQEPLVALGRVVEDLGLRPWAAGGPAGARELGALEDLLDLVRYAGSSKVQSFGDAVALLKASLEARGEGEGAGFGAAVRLMNLHQAKGLEAPVVFLANPARGVSHDPTRHIDRGERPKGYFTFRTASRGRGGGRLVAAPPGWEQVRQLEQQFANAEKTRLLYVAATRAMQLLVLSRNESGMGWWSPLEPLANPAWPLTMAPAATHQPEALGEVATSVAQDLARERTTLQAAAVPSYRAETVTSQPGPLPGHDAPGARGAAWGTAVHRLLALTAQGLPSEFWAAACSRVLEEEGASGTAEELHGVLQRFWASPLGTRVRRSPKVLCEVPFAEMVGGQEVPTVLHGVIDLLFFEEGGWVLVDYKSDAAAVQGTEELVRHYAPQLSRYAEFWRGRLGQPVADALLFFTATMRAISIHRPEGGAAWQTSPGD
jgi:ATP-dependent helicase/nuclease subunit A